MAGAPGQKKQDPLMIVIMLCVAVIAVYFAAALGTAMDLAKDHESGEIKFSELAVEATMSDYDLVFEHLQDKESYAPKLAMFAGMGIGIYALLKATSKKRLHRKGVEHGSARWATVKEALKLADNDKKRKKAGIDNNIILTNDVKMSLDTRQHRENLNVLVIGGSGSGKTRFYVKPNLMQMNTSYVVTDPKGEILRSTGKMLEKVGGYKIKVFNLIDMANSHNYNPFAYVYDKDGNVNKVSVIKMINVLMKNTKQEGATGGDQFWDDATKALLSALAFYLCEVGEPEDRNWANVMQLLKYADVKEGKDDFKSPLDIKFDELEEKNPISMAVTYYKDFKKAAGETAKSILISCAVRLQAFNLPEVADLTHTDTIALETLGDRKTALFVIIPSSDSTFNFLAAMMYTQLFDTLYDRANFKYGGRLPVHVRCMLDEFANIGTIPDFDKLLATMRSMEISANIIIQNISQLKKMYEKSWEILTGNCDSQLFLGGKEKSTLKDQSELLGKETIDIVAQNRTKGHRNNSSSYNNSIHGRELMTADELSIMPISDCILTVRAFHPFYCKKFDIEKHKNYKYLEDSNKNYAYDLSGIKTLEMPSKGGFRKEDHTEPAAEAPAAEITKEDIMSSVIEVPDEDNELEIEFETPAEKIFSEATDETVEEISESQPLGDFSFDFVDTSKPLALEGSDEFVFDNGLFTE